MVIDIMRAAKGDAPVVLVVVAGVHIEGFLIRKEDDSPRVLMAETGEKGS